MAPESQHRQNGTITRAAIRPICGEHRPQRSTFWRASSSLCHDTDCRTHSAQCAHSVKCLAALLLRKSTAIPFVLKQLSNILLNEDSLHCDSQFVNNGNTKKNGNSRRRLVMSRKPWNSAHGTLCQDRGASSEMLDEQSAKNPKAPPNKCPDKKWKNHLSYRNHCQHSSGRSGIHERKRIRKTDVMDITHTMRVS